MAIAKSRRFAPELRPMLPPLLLLLSVFLIIDQANSIQATDATTTNATNSQCDEGQRGAQQAPQEQPRLTRNRRQLDLIENALSLVGRPFSRRSDSSASSRLYTGCPSKTLPSRMGGVFMRFHRLGDWAVQDELRVNEMASGEAWDLASLDSIVRSRGFDLSKPTLMYTGGWLQDSSERWLREIRSNYDQLYQKQSRAAYNLLFFDWSALAYSDYGRSVAAVPELGQKLARFFEHLRDQHKYNLAQLHLVSFSLSTHIVGLAARRLAEGGSGSVGQITYLDPTGVCFHNGKKFGETYGARADDAALTVARHYNMFGFGASRLIGGLDIIVNDGKAQPAMSPNSNSNSNNQLSVRAMFDVMGGRSFPSHLRASVHEYEPFQLDSDCHEMAYQCKDYDHFQAGECGSCGKHNQSCYLISTTGNIQLGGSRQLATRTSYKPNTQMFLNTARGQFCAYEYQVILELGERPTAALKRSLADLSVEVSAGVQVAPTHRRGTKYTQLLTLEKRIVSFKRKIDMRKQEQLLQAIKSLSLRYLSHVSPERRAKYSFKYCPNTKARELVDCK